MNLDFVPTSDLVAELAKRFDTMIFVAQNERGDEDHGQHHIHGQTLTLVGIMEREKYILLQDMLDGSREGDDD